jgi:HSP20 family protein
LAEQITMSTLERLRGGLSRTWESVTEGWRELVERAGDALTRFHPTPASHEVETPGDRMAREGSRWGVVAAEVVLGDDNVGIAMEVPGMEAGDFDIDIVDDVLVVRGEKKVQREHKSGQYHIMERAYGRFERALRLPVAVNEAGAEASYRRGVLHHSIPPSTPVAQSRRHEVISGR